MIKQNILETIGNTPMVRINRLCTKKDVNIYAKLEGFNPTGSIKDRIAVQMIEQAEQEGKLSPGKTIIEPTSGNTGIGLAIIGIVKGYEVEIVMSEAVSVERRKIIRSYGGRVILTPASEGTDGAIRKARQLVKANPGKYFMPDQFQMPEIIRLTMKIQLLKSGNKPKAVSIISSAPWELPARSWAYPNS